MSEKNTKPVKAIKKTMTPAKAPAKAPANALTKTPGKRDAETLGAETEMFSEVTHLVDELVDELKKVDSAEPTPKQNTADKPTNNTGSEVGSEAGSGVDPNSSFNRKRSDLIKLSEDGEITQSVSYIKKASTKIVDKLYSEYENKRMNKANEFLTDMLISRFSNILGGLDAVESSGELETELQKDKLLKSDVIKVVSMVTPYLPCLGLLSGGITVGKHVYQKKIKVVEKEPKN